MKKLISLAFSLFIFMTSFSQIENYQTKMKELIAKLDSSNSPDAFTDLANTFERIGNMEKTEWLPIYYSAFCNIMAANFQQGNTKVQQELADKAESYIAKAEALAKDNSEISCLKSMHATLMLMINPMQNGMTFGPKAAAYIEDAINQDPTNPRPYLLDGQLKFYTPERWGGDKVKAKEQMQKALELYDKFRPASPIHPVWGKAQAGMMLKQM